MEGEETRIARFRRELWPGQLAGGGIESGAVNALALRAGVSAEINEKFIRDPIGQPQHQANTEQQGEFHEPKKPESRCQGKRRSRPG